jgi:hypothetical protein
MVTKKIIRLTESDLHRVVKESVNIIISEIFDNHTSPEVKGLAAAAFKASNDENADPKWRERKERQYGKLFDKSLEMAKKHRFDPMVDLARADSDFDKIHQGMEDPKGYIEKYGFGKYLSGKK